MKCKKHYTDLSGNVGVCASCLRERLFPLVVAQEQAQTLGRQIRDLETHQVFPPVSSYVSRRKTSNSVSTTGSQLHSDRNRNHSVPDGEFFSTPQIAPTAGSYKKKKHRFIRFSLLMNLFRSKKRKENTDPDPKSSVYVSDNRRSSGGDDSATSAMSSPFSFSNIKSGGGCRKKQSFCYSEAASTASGAGVMRKQYCPDRGMSPVRSPDCGGAEDQFDDRSGGYETCESQKQTPWRTPVRHGGGGGQVKNISGLSFCLSPLVRVSPCRHWKQKGVAPVDSGEIRAPVKPQFCANRSRKVADFGRFNTNR